MKEETRMMCENKSAAHAVNGSMSGRAEQISKAVSADSVPETGGLSRAAAWDMSRRGGWRQC